MELVEGSRVNVPTVRNELRDQTPQLGEVLRAARLARNLTLDAVQARTNLKREFFDDLERNDLSRWPSSPFYRESYLRAYASAIGLDPRHVVDEFRRLQAPPVVRDVPLPLPTPRRLTPRTIPLIIAVTFVIAYSLGRWWQPASQSPAQHSVAAASGSANDVQGRPSRQSDVVLPVATEALEAGEIEGELLITSTPSGAHVTVNGIGRGLTPVRVRFLPAGSYAVRFVRAGHPVITRHVTISPGKQQARVSARLASTQATK